MFILLNKTFIIIINIENNSSMNTKFKRAAFILISYIL